MREVIQKVMAAEAEAQQLVRAARIEADQCLEQARQQARQRVEQARREAKLEAANLLASAERDADREKALRLARAREQIGAAITLDELTKQQAVAAALRCLGGMPP